MNNMEVFGELVKKDPGLLSRPIEELAPISFVGQSAVSAYRSIISRLDSLPMSEEQKAKTLKDGQDAGKMLLAIEARIGELCEPLHMPDGDRMSENFQRKRAAAEATGLNHKQRSNARTIHANPEAVEEVYDACDIQLSENKYEMLYQKRTGQSVLSSVKKFFNNNHINFVAPKIDGAVHYGFTNDRALIENYMDRMTSYYKAYGRAHRTAKMITAGQLELDIAG